MPYFTKKGIGTDKGKTCVYKKSSKKKVGCTAGPVEKYLTALRMAESNELDWLIGPPQLKFGDIKHNISDYFSVGDKIYLTGVLYLDEESTQPIELNNEPVTVKTIRPDTRKSKMDIIFGENITTLPLWQNNMNGDYVDLGTFESDDYIVVTFPNKSIKESEDLSWIENVPSNEIVRPWNGTIGSWTTPIYDRVYLYTDDDVTREVKVGGLTSKYRKRNRKGEWFGSDGDIRFYDASISDEEIKAFNGDPEYPDPFEGKYEITMSRREYNDNARKGKLILTPNKVGINESEMDFGWTDDFQWTTDMLLSMLENCNEIKVSNYNLQMDSPYIMRGESTIYTLTRCEEWWDKFSQIPLDDNGRGPAEWYQDYDEGRIGVLASYEPNKNPREMDIEKDGWTITQYPQEIINSLNGKHSELFILLGKDGRPVYDLIPKKYRERVKTNWEDRFFGEKLNESEEDEFDWVRDVEIDLVPGEIYDIKTGNGYYWVPEKYVGKGWDEEYQTEFYKFKDIDGSGSSGRKSVPYVKELMEKGQIRPYDPNWSIKDELIFSNNIEDALKGNFVIYFKDGIYLDQTLPIQDKLFEMGFSFYTKKPNEYITNKDHSDKIQFFECFNWDISNPRYSRMPSDQWDKKKILLSKVKKDDEFRWRPKPRRDEQELFSTVKDHNATVINGDKYIKNNINEVDDWSWAKEIPGTKEYGQRYRYFEILACYGIDWETEECDDVYSHFIRIPIEEVDEVWNIPDVDFDYLAGPGDEGEGVIMYAVKNRLISVYDLNEIVMYEGVREISYDQYIDKMGEPDEMMNEENEFDWIQKQEPEKEIKKSKKYVVDVSHLRPAPMKHSHNPSLTKQDILRKLEEIGYDVDHIDVDRAKYFYVEPTEGGPSWQYNEYGVPIEFDYWVDYNTDLMDDPSYGGKYQTIDVDEFMFLIDNNMVSESGLDWLQNMGEPMSICEVYPQVKVGDTIIVDYLEAWEDSPDEELVDANNATATVLAVDKCKEIQPNNLSTNPTILVHFNEPYTGFDKLWVRDFKPEYREVCADGRCMFLICEDDSYDSVKITNLGSSILGENKKPINEAAGISFEVRKWAEIIYNEIISNPEEKNRLIIDGYDYPEAFDGFPIDYVVIDYYDRLTGYGQEHSGYDKDGNYVVLLYIQPSLVRGQGGYSLQSALNHEMKHAWEDYNRLSKGLPSVEQTKESQEMYNRDYILMLSDQNVRGPIKEILKYYYYLSNLEKSAYLENVYDQNPAYERVVREIAGMNFEPFKERFDLDVNWHLMNTAYDIPFLKKFKSPIDFIDYSAEELRSKALKMIKKINKMKYIHQK